MSTFTYPDEIYKLPYQPDLPLPQSNLVQNPVPFYVTMNSADRDRLKYPSTSEYQIFFNRYKNIQSVKLLSCVIPNTGNVLNEPYLLLEIKEFEGMYDAASIASSRAFSKLYFHQPSGSEDFLRLDRGVGDPLTLVFWPDTKASIDRLTVAFRLYDGTVFNFGDDTGNVINPLLQTNITLEIRSLVPDCKTALGHRNN